MYALGSSAGETARLQRQAGELGGDSAALLDRVGLRPGQSAIDLGCGPPESWTCLLPGCHLAVMSSASTPTPRMRRWPPSSLPDWPVWRS